MDTRLGVRGLQFLLSAIEGFFGLLALVMGLAAVSVVPVVNLVSLGYLLHVGGAVARTGRLRDGLAGIRPAARLGGIVLAVWLLLWPARILATMRDAARIVDPDGARGWNAALGIVAGLTCLHIVWALLRGGRLRHFLWPAPLRFVRWLRSPGKFAEARDGLWEFCAGLRLPYLFWLGARGFVGTVLWLLLPVGLMMASAEAEPGGGSFLLAFAGCVLLAPVLLLLPFLQTLLAREDRFGAIFAVGSVRRLGARAPFLFWLALSATLTLAVPLFLLKIELTPREITWLPSLLFVATGFPARLLTGWAMGRAGCREAPRHFMVRWFYKACALPVALAYGLILFLTQYLSWNGSLSLLEQHAFLVPTPF